MAGGRPTVMTDAVVKKLEEAFALGCSDLEACLFAGISKPTLYAYCEANPSFSDRRAALKTNPVLKARKVVMDAVEDGDVNTAKWLVEKHDGKAKQAVEHSGGETPVQVVFGWANDTE